MKGALLAVAIIFTSVLIHLPRTLPIASVLQSVPIAVYLIFSFILLLTASLRYRILGGTITIFVFAISWTVAASGAISRDNTVHGLQQPLIVTTWNTQYWDQAEASTDFLRQLRELSADVLMLQEHLYKGMPAARAQFFDKSAALVQCCAFKNVWHKGELVLASDLEGEEVPVDDPFVQAVRFGENDRGFTAINVHIPVHFDVERSPFQKDFWTYVVHKHSVRLKSLTALKKLLGETDVAVVGGDFNATVLMPSLRSSILTTTDLNLADVFSPSFPAETSVPSLWRLDLLLGRNAGPRTCTVLRVQNTFKSDHWPVRCLFHGPTL